MVPIDLSPGDWAVLGELAERPSHGFALAQLLEPGGPLGRVWSIPRPVVYQSLKKLLGAGLVEETATEPSERGPSRTILAATAEGRRLVRVWLDQPVDHVRDVRSLLLLKLALIERSGADSGPLLEEQRRRLETQRRSLTEALASAEGFDRVILQWRLSGSAATIDFLDAVTR